MPDETTPWVVKGVPLDTRRAVKVYAAMHDMTMAQAVERLVNIGARYSNTELLDDLLVVCRAVLDQKWEAAHATAWKIQKRYMTDDGSDGERISVTEMGRIAARLRALNEEDPTE